MLTKFNVIVGCGIFLEHVVVLLIWVSAINKMNLHSIFDFVIIILFTYTKRFNTMKFLMNSITVVLVLRLLLILSNMTQQLNPMTYPVQFEKPESIS